MDYESFITMIGSSGDLGNAIDQYGSVIFLALIRAMVLLVGIGLEPGTIKNALVTASKYSPLPVIFLITAILFFAVAKARMDYLPLTMALALHSSTATNF